MTKRIRRAPTHIKDLRPDPKNARAHNPKNIGLIVDSLHEVGAGRSIVIDEDNQILAGNGTIEAAAEAGITKLRVIDADGDTVIAVRRSNLTLAQKQRLALFDNRTAETATWDLDVLREFAASGVNLSKIWAVEELAALLATDDVKGGNTDPDDVPAERPTGIVAGDLFELGAHRLLCGDCTKAEDVNRVMAGTTAAILWTDPPYGVSYTGKTKRALTIANDRADGLAPLLAASFANVGQVLAPGAPFYIARSTGELSVVFGTAIVAAGWHIHEELQWVKDSMVLGHSDYHLRHETVVYGWKPGAQRPWYAGRSETSVFEIARPKSSPDHPTTKPVDLVLRHLVNSSRGDDIVIEPFAGSGTTLIASEQLGRSCRGIELLPVYCQVIIDRWEAFTGHRAKAWTGQKAKKVGEAVRA